MNFKTGLLREFLHEAEGTRKLLQGVPDTALMHRPQPHLWSVAELALHIANIYSWFDGTFNHDVFELSTMEKPDVDLSKSENIVAEFEKNYQNAKTVLENSDESTFLNDWQMQMQGKTLIGPAPKISMIRGFLFNHLYHHRGELVAHLRTLGLPVPGLYGPTYEDMHPMA